MFTNQKSKYLDSYTNIDFSEIIQISAAKYSVPSETFEDVRYLVDMQEGICKCRKGYSKGPCKHKKTVAKKFNMKFFDLLPKENEKMRAFYHFLGTGTVRDARWFRPLDAGVEGHDDDNDDVLVQVPLADWNDDENIEEEYSLGDAQSNNMEISGSSSEDDISGNTKVEAISCFKKSIFGLISQVERNFEKDEKVYVKAIKAFEKTSIRIIKGKDACLQKALFTFGKEIVQPAQKRKRKNSGKIPVQSTAKSRRKIKHRGAGPSIQGRPTAAQTLRLQLDVQEEDEIVSHKIPSSKKKKKSNPHSLAAAVAANRAAEKKH